MDHGLIFNIQRFSLHDGPGIRTTVFLKGCPLSCRWCHNPESRSSEPEIRVIEFRCARCGRCEEVCPRHVATVAGEAHDDCTHCGACVAACPTGARQMVGREMSVDDVLGEVLRDRIFHDQSGGGVTLSGGEPLSQAPFVKRLLRAFRRHSIHTALDTAGFAPKQTILEIAPWVDLFLYDIKSLDDRAHQDQTGGSNALILENVKTLGEIHDNIWIRVPLIPDFNLEAEQLEAMARLISSIAGVRQVNLLKYHTLGTGKGPRSESGSGLAEAGDVSQAQVDAAAAIFRAAGLQTVIGG